VGDGKGNLNPIQPAYNNLRTQFQNNTTASQAITRGAYENAVAQGANNRNGSDGYTTNPADPSYLDPQTYCIVTPGRHAIIMQDDPHFARLRFKTAEGHQVIFDDANERIYVSTSKGNTWFEMDVDGHINIFGAQSFSIRTGGDLNLYADGDINMEAGGGFNLICNSGDARITTAQNFQVVATQNIVESACGIFDMNAEKAMHLTAAQDLDIRSNQGIYATGDSGVDIKSGAAINATASTSIGMGAPNITIDADLIMGISGLATTVEGITTLGLGGASIFISTDAVVEPVPPVIPPVPANTADEATCAEDATSPSVIPEFEPWVRPVSSTPRGPYWKP